MIDFQNETGLTLILFLLLVFIGVNNHMEVKGVLFFQNVTPGLAILSSYLPKSCSGYQPLFLMIWPW